MKYYYINEDNKLCEIESKKKIKNAGFYLDPIEAIEYMLDLQKHCLSNEEHAVVLRKEKLNVLQQMYCEYINK